MKFEARKIENCFADSRTYEYELPVDGENFLKYIPDWKIRINEKLRRPTAIAERQRVIIKFILKNNRFRVSFPEESWEKEKNKFEMFLEKLE